MDEVGAKRLLNLKEYCEYVCIKETKAREILNSPSCPYVVRIGNRLRVDKHKLDRYLDRQHI